jgi:hypothetical protein
MAQKKRFSHAVQEVQQEMVNLCELSSSSTNPEAFETYGLLMKSWRKVWEQLPKLGQVSELEANAAMSEIEDVCSKMGVRIN